MTIADQLERNLRDRVARNLDQSRTVLVSLITAPIHSVSGQLAGGVMVDSWQESGDTYTSTARSLAPYSQFVDKGTGVYPPGGRGSPIVATHAGKVTKSGKVRPPMLKFYWYNRGEWVFRPSVLGMPAQNFFSEPLPQNYRNALTASWGP